MKKLIYFSLIFLITGCSMIKGNSPSYTAWISSSCESAYKANSGFTGFRKTVIEIYSDKIIESYFRYQDEACSEFTNREKLNEIKISHSERIELLDGSPAVFTCFPDPENISKLRHSVYKIDKDKIYFGGHGNGCDEFNIHQVIFKNPALISLKDTYNQTLKAQPSAAGDAAKGAP